MIHPPTLRGRVAHLLLLALLVTIAPGIAVASESTPPGVVNVNTATDAELVLLPGVGEAKARAILAERERRGRFEQVDDLLDVKGIGAAALERMRPYVALDGRTTLATP